MEESFFNNFNWNSFWMNTIVSSIFLILSIVISIKLIPYFTVKLIKRKRKVFIVSKVSLLIQELSNFLEFNQFRTIEIRIL